MPVIYFKFNVQLRHRQALLWIDDVTFLKESSRLDKPVKPCLAKAPSRVVLEDKNRELRSSDLPD
jgi:hypothetical protein